MDMISVDYIIPNNKYLYVETHNSIYPFAVSLVEPTNGFCDTKPYGIRR